MLRNHIGSSSSITSSYLPLSSSSRFLLDDLPMTFPPSDFSKSTVSWNTLDPSQNLNRSMTPHFNNRLRAESEGLRSDTSAENHDQELIRSPSMSSLDSYPDQTQNAARQLDIRVPSSSLHSSRYNSYGMLLEEYLPPNSVSTSLATTPNIDRSMVPYSGIDPGCNPSPYQGSLSALTKSRSLEVQQAQMATNSVIINDPYEILREPLRPQIAEEKRIKEIRDIAAKSMADEKKEYSAIGPIW